MAVHRRPLAACLLLLPFLDRDISSALEQAMTERLRITFHWKERVTACDNSKPGSIVLSLSSGTTFEADSVLVAAGRQSNTAALNLEAAGVEVGERGRLAVDSTFRTNVPHIYAAGDVIGFPALASTSMTQARLAMCHAFQCGYQKTLENLLPNGIYTIPEVSIVGQAEEDLKGKGISYVIGRAAYAPVGEGLLGRVVDGLGRPLDGKPLADLEVERPLQGASHNPLNRKPVVEPTWVGVRALDGTLTLGKGQRIGIFAGGGVGKSTLLGAMVRNCKADVAVLSDAPEQRVYGCRCFEH